MVEKPGFFLLLKNDKFFNIIHGKTKLILIFKKPQRLKPNRLKINSLFIDIHKNTNIKRKCNTWKKSQAVLLSQNNKNFILIHGKNKIDTDF